ncbi:MAG: hypothetical protein PWP76_578 [Candidatus Diapherotrites archaeon]|nr:hypothetical protein [Candidatus Diapherotrites archaeon]MDN5367156.1 hypothetical protein [Candidatus Diapherotrites archaeon]
MRVGTCGWGYFRPKTFGITEYSSVLEAYSRLFDTVEVNSTFYRIPRASTAERWRKEVPDDFVFTVKMYRDVTHEKRFENVEEETEKILEVAKALRAPIILIQTPKSFKQTEENKRKVLGYLSTLPKTFRYALELRGWTWNDKFAEWIWVVDPFAEKPVEQEEHYFRLHGKPPGERMYHYKYTDADLTRLKELVLSLNTDNVWVMFNNVWMYEDALRFKGMLDGR